MPPPSGDLYAAYLVGAPLQAAARGEEFSAPEPAAEPAPAATVLPMELDPDVDRERRIGILRDYLARIQRNREVGAR